MSVTAALLANLICDIGSGQNKTNVVFGQDAFTTTGTDRDVTVPLKNIRAFFAFYIGAPAATESPLSFNETVSNGTLRSTAVQDVTVTRPAGTTSGIKFFWIAFGDK
jgi:hypothetical protein